MSTHKLLLKLSIIVVSLIAIGSFLVVPVEQQNAKFLVNLIFIEISVACVFIWPIMQARKPAVSDRILFGIGPAVILGLYAIATFTVMVVSIGFSFERTSLTFGIHLLLLIPVALYIVPWFIAALKVEDVEEMTILSSNAYRKIQLELGIIASLVETKINDVSLAMAVKHLSEEVQFNNSLSNVASSSYEHRIMECIANLHEQLTYSDIDTGLVLTNIRRISELLKQRETVLKYG
jgi:hypothetical protein